MTKRIGKILAVVLCAALFIGALPMNIFAFVTARR